MSQRKVNLTQLRERAEQAINQGRSSLTNGSNHAGEMDLDHLVEELTIYQTELEIQNEALALAQSETATALEQYRALFGHLPLPALIVDPRGFIVEANAQADALLGMSLPHTLNRGSVLQLFDLDSRGALHQALKGLLHATPSIIDCRGAPRDGAEGIPYEVHITQLPGTSAQAGHRLFVLVDRSAELALQMREEELSALNHSLEQRVEARTAELAAAQVQTEQALDQAARAEARFRTIFEQAPLGIALTDSLSGQILEVNERFGAIAGRTREELAHINWMQITHPHDLQTQLDSLARPNAGEITGFQMEKRYQRPDGSLVWISLTIAPVNGDVTEGPCHLKLIEDISVQKALEQDLRTAKATAEAANAAKSAFLANMSHEVRTPMNAVLGFLDVLLDTRLDAEQRALVQSVKGAGQGLLRIINDILDLSKLEAGKMSLESAPFRLDAVLQQVAELLSLSAQEKGLELVIDAPPEIAGGYRGDALRLSQILNNLVGNAIKFSERGSVVIAVQSLGETDGERQLRVEVRDRGIGLTPEQAAGLFQPFTQADASTARRFGGTGLGLTICRRLIERMGGAIGVDSSEGEGSTFWFTLPLMIDDNATERVPTTEPRAASTFAAAPIRGSRLLLVEDNAINQAVAVAFLRKLGLRTRVASNGREALEQLKTEHFDLVLMDLQMPVMDGLEATAAIRATHWGHEIPIIAMTAAAFPEDRARALDAGMNDYVSKPIDLQQLVDALLRWLPARAEAPVEPAAEPVTESAPDLATKSVVAGCAAVAEAISLADCDLEATRQRLGNDEALLRSVLEYSQREFRDWPAQFAAARDGGELKVAQRLAHTLKDVAANVGAARVRATAAALEAALAEQAGPELVERLRADCVAALGAAMTALRNATEPGGASKQQASSTS
ncbi:response regulator [Thiohalocapsa marina]|uniref:histidine kinase n=1 Tax=Thiohalocapsa marina TaxID=424902 RepID=A0A5M8FS87_9GAMM|nr:ATP-binding protein [Thiohalocapsa marina]KAA6186225.1 response regulator [Thiohalocapsa marina]